MGRLEQAVALLARRHYRADGTAKRQVSSVERPLIRLNITPEQQEAYIQRGKMAMEEIAKRYPHALLDPETVEQNLAFLSPNHFANPKKAILPSHDILHVGGVNLLGGSLSGVAMDREEQKPERERVAIDREAIDVATITHDLPRYWWDTVASLPVVNYLHGIAAKYMVPIWFADLPENTMQRAQEAVRYHDYHQTPSKHKTPTTELTVLADRLQLVRLLFDPTWGKSGLRRIFEHRMGSYHLTYFPELRELYIPVAEALYIQSVTNLNARVEDARDHGQQVKPEDHIAALVKAAEQLGMFTREQTETVNVPDEISTSPAA